MGSLCCRAGACHSGGIGIYPLTAEGVQRVCGTGRRVGLGLVAVRGPAWASGLVLIFCEAYG